MNLCVLLYTVYLSYSHKKFQVASTYDANVENQIRNFCYYISLRYIDKKHTRTHTQANCKKK